MSRHAPRVELSSRERLILEKLSRSRTIPKRVAERVAFVLWSASGETCVAQAERMGVDAQRSRRWRRRWSAARGKLLEAEAKDATDDELEALLRDVLADRARARTAGAATVEEPA